MPSLHSLPGVEREMGEPSSLQDIPCVSEGGQQHYMAAELNPWRSRWRAPHERQVHGKCSQLPHEFLHEKLEKFIYLAPASLPPHPTRP